jgi:7-carboxy-7-deazaguanine synthase
LKSIKVNEIFYSLQGESSRVGLPTAFVRLTGCPMRCSYCDTSYAFSEGKNMSIDSVIKKVKEYKTNYITVTGGEPLAQKSCWDLLKTLCDEGYSVSLETGGGLSINNIDSRVKIILDIKTPNSGESESNFWENLLIIKPSDEIKFVIENREDYEWSKNILLSKDLFLKVPIIFSPVYKKLKPKKLSEWILKDNLPVRLQIQLHKIIWGEISGV